MSITINGTTGLSGVDGSAGTPALQGSDPNTGIYSPGANQVAVATNGTGRVFVDSIGNIGVGTSTPASNGSTFATLSLNGSNGGAQHFMSAGNTVMQLYNDANAFFVNAYTGKQVIVNTGGAERLRITSDAYVRLASGSGGIQFNGDTAAANALDDYEEGTWTPVITSAGYTLIGASTSGYYTKIGNLVSVHFQARFSAVGSNTASAAFSGLPFNSNSAFYHTGVCRESTAYGDIFVAQAVGSIIAINSMDGVVNGDNASFATNRNYNTQLTYFV